ncbi:MAG TPA: hypothetical protein VK831_02515 [Candidatus Deferrimicrobiaceae bacterium]|nr:hypothetical protein [Candidatus Deferrimicrobiaceae bacterium]
MRPHLVSPAALLAAAALLVAACGGPATGGSDAPDGGTPPSTTDSPATDTPAPEPPGGGDIILGQEIAGALAALEAQGSWMFEVTVIAPSSGGDLSIVGTERREPVPAVSAQHTTQGTEFRYIRIGDDIWFDVGIGEWTHVDADSARNLISQYEPYHAAGLVGIAATAVNNEFELLGQEEVNGVMARHYRMTEHDRAAVTERLGLTPDQWLGDVWIATDGGYLVRFQFGPESFEVLQQTGGIGFLFNATDFGCTCPVEPPE